MKIFGRNLIKYDIRNWTQKNGKSNKYKHASWWDYLMGRKFLYSLEYYESWDEITYPMLQNFAKRNKID